MAIKLTGLDTSTGKTRASKDGEEMVVVGDLQLGDGNSDDIDVQGEFVSNLVPNATETYDLGSAAKRWQGVYTEDVVVTRVRSADNSTTNKIRLLNNKVEIYANHSANQVCTIDSTGLSIDTGGLKAAGNLSVTFDDDASDGNATLTIETKEIAGGATATNLLLDPAGTNLSAGYTLRADLVDAIATDAAFEVVSSSVPSEVQTNKGKYIPLDNSESGVEDHVGFSIAGVGSLGSSDVLNVYFQQRFRNFDDDESDDGWIYFYSSSLGNTTGSLKLKFELYYDNGSAWVKIDNASSDHSILIWDPTATTGGQAGNLNADQVYWFKLVLSDGVTSSPAGDLADLVWLKFRSGANNATDILDMSNASIVKNNEVGSPQPVELMRFSKTGRRVRQSVPDNAPGDGDLANGTLIFYIDNDDLKVRVKKSDGSVKVGTVAALTPP